MRVSRYISRRNTIYYIFVRFLLNVLCCHVFSSCLNLDMLAIWNQAAPSFSHTVNLSLAVFLGSSAPRRSAVTWTTSSATGGSWKRGSPTHLERGPSRICLLALRWSCCTGSVITAWMLLMSSTCWRYDTREEQLNEPESIEIQAF